MTFSGFGRYAITSCAAVAMLAGCGGSQLSVGSADTGPARLQERSALTASTKAAPTSDSKSGGYKVTLPLLYVTDIGANYNDIRIYRAEAKDPTPVATISDGVDTPFGACADAQGTLYVTNEPASGPGWVSEYVVGKTAPSKTITDGTDEPAFCAIDAKGNLWVANIYGPNVSEYLYGSTKPHTVITSGLVYPIGIAIDRSGNLYVGNGFGASQQNVEVYAAGSKTPSRTITNGVTSPCGITVDSSGTLYVANQFQNNVEEYRSGQNDPFQAITKAVSGPTGVTVNKKGVLYVANLGNHSVAEFAPGSLTPLKRQITKGLWDPVGIAYYPALLP
jgi:sugar lactone lactonase YvrE